MNAVIEELPDFFISRAGADADIAGVIGRVLESAGHRVVLQQWDFANRNFMEQMHQALSSGARVIALLSNDYLASKHCEAEWLNAIAHDPLNTNGRLILLRVGECTPKGLLTALAYWDLVPVREQDDLLADIVRAAIMPDAARRLIGPTGEYWRSPRTVLHPEIKPTPGFTGRDRELAALGEALWRGETAAVTQPAAVHGLGGVGKSTLAREYAWRERDFYAGVWWLNAERTKGAEGFEGIEKGLVELGAIFIRGLGEAQDRAAAARQTLNLPWSSSLTGGSGQDRNDHWLRSHHCVEDHAAGWRGHRGNADHCGRPSIRCQAECDQRSWRRPRLRVLPTESSRRRRIVHDPERGMGGGDKGVSGAFYRGV
jgi:hypothetical protein